MGKKSLYLFLGSETGEKNDEIQKLQNTLQKQLGAIDVYTYFATDAKLSEIIIILENESLFSRGRFVVLKNAELIKKKEDIELLQHWVENAKDNTILVLVSDENSLDKKIENCVPKENKKIFWEMFENKKETWLRNLFQSKGFSVTSDGIEAILDLVENNTEALKKECEHFFLYFEKNHTISKEDVENLLAHNREETVFSLFETMTEFHENQKIKLEKTLQVFQKIRNSKDSSGVQFIAGLSYCFRKLIVWYSLHAQKNPSDLDYKIHGFASKKAQTQYRNACKIWSYEQTKKILALLIERDAQIRSMGQQCEETVLQLLLYEIIFCKTQGIAKYPNLQEFF